MLSISLFGDFRLSYDNQLSAEFDSPRLQALMAFLLLQRGAPQSRGRIASLFWPDTSEEQARTNLRNLLHHLRHALPDADDHLLSTPQTLQWNPAIPINLDVAKFEESLARAQDAIHNGRLTEARDCLVQATALYAGDLLPACYDDWLIPHRETLRQACIDALEQLVQIQEERLEYLPAIRSAQRLLQIDPLHEATYRLLMRLHALNNNRAGALRVYHTCQTTLRRELEVDPSPSTRAVYEQLLGATLPAARPDSTALSISTLVGREREWSRLTNLWRALSESGPPRCVLLRGEAGIGKTRLIEELMQWASRQGIACASARCYAAEGDLAFAPLVTCLRALPLPPLEDVWLAEVGRVLPEVFTKHPHLPRPAPVIDPFQRGHLFESLSRALLGGQQPLILAIDDLQWCDQETLDWLHFLLRFDRQARLLILGAYRPEEIDDVHPLTPWLAALRSSDQLVEIDLPPLDQAATLALANLAAEQPIDDASAQILYQETEGNPLFIVETVRAGFTAYRTAASTAVHSEPRSLPPRVAAVLQARLAQVAPQARQLAELAAVIGREFSFRLLQQASGEQEETLARELDQLWRRRIVREHGVDGYDFSHDKLREVAYQGLSQARRRFLHRRVAESLEELHAHQLAPVSRQIGAHYEQAALPRQAAPYYLQAARQARQVFANQEAIELLRHAVVLVESGGAAKPPAGLAVQIWEELGDVLAVKAQHTDALQAYQAALMDPAGLDPLWLARLHRKRGAVLREQRLYADDLAACDQAELALGPQPAGGSLAWREEWLEIQVERVWAYYWLAQWPQMDALIGKLGSVVEKQSHSPSRMRFLMASCLLQLRKRRYNVTDEMLADSRESLEASRQWGGIRIHIECQFELGFLHLWRRELDQAEQNLKAALELADAAGILPVRTIILTYLTVLHRFRGEEEAVADFAQRCLAAAEAAGMPDYTAAAQANLAWLAWRRQDLAEVEKLGCSALELWRRTPLVYPFQWMALWPLLAASLAQAQEEKAWKFVRQLLDPVQQRLPDALNSALETALEAKEQAEDGHANLEHALRLAVQMGYV